MDSDSLFVERGEKKRKVIAVAKVLCDFLCKLYISPLSSMCTPMVRGCRISTPRIKVIENANETITAFSGALANLKQRVEVALYGS